MRREWASAEEDSGAGQWVVLVDLIFCFSFVFPLLYFCLKLKC